MANEVEQLSQPELVKLYEAAQEAVNCNIQMESLKERKKDIADRVKDEFGLPPAKFNAIVAEFYNEGTSKKVDDLTEKVELAEEVKTAYRNSRRNTGQQQED